MYLIEQFSRLQADGRDDTVSVFMPALDEEKLTPELKEQVSTFMRMAATFAKMAAVQNNPKILEEACRALNRAMAENSKDGGH